MIGTGDEQTDPDVCSFRTMYEASREEKQFRACGALRNVAWRGLRGRDNLEQRSGFLVGGCVLVL